jgi:DNA helicase-2/ATP-dependent DNA helicase PcrA
MIIQNLLDDLNEAQRAAVAADAKHLLVLAGAGSGKTRVLVHRIAWLMAEQRLAPYQILAVTFTNKAAHEMRGRIESACQQSVQGMWVGTFHSISHRFLRTHWQAAGLPESFQILDSDDQLRLIKRTLQSLDLDEDRWPARKAQWFINQQKDEGKRAAQRLREYQQAPGNRHQLTWLRVYESYENTCQRSGLVDFAELLLRTYEVLGRDQQLLAHYQSRFQHVLVDEFQDTNDIQYAWLKRLAGDHAGLTLVGDDDQSIYGWRGAKIENIQQFHRDFPQGTLVRLEQNYRSTQSILSAANAVIANNQGRLGKKLWTEDNAGSPIQLFAGYNEVDEARFIAERITNYKEVQGSEFKDCAILYRSNAQSRVLEEALIREGIPYRIYGGLRFFDRAEIKNALCYLRLIFNPSDDAAFERIVSVPPRGIGEKTISSIRDLARDDDVSLWQATQKTIASKSLPARALRAVDDFVQLIQSFMDGKENCVLSEFIERVIQLSGLIAYYQKEKGEKAQARLENLKELLSAAREFESLESDDQPGSVLSAFLDHAALESGELQADAEEDCVQMMTLHAAKGLEFPLVFMSGMEEGLFPHQRNIDDPSGLEEERRLAYVGMTRAMKQLVITYAEVRRLFGSEKRCFLSRFVREIPDDLLKEVRLSGALSRPAGVSAGYGRQTISTRPSQGGASSQAFSENVSVHDLPFQLGQRVNHKIFGEGTVLTYEGSGDHARIQINFDREGTKWLVVNYAKLEPA